jgi:hypothetical protein
LAIELQRVWHAGGEQFGVHFWSHLAVWHCHEHCGVQLSISAGEAAEMPMGIAASSGTCATVCCSCTSEVDFNDRWTVKPAWPLNFKQEEYIMQ